MPVVTAPQGLCRFGIARGDITPPVGIYYRMWGAALHDRAEGVHQPLLATAMVFRPAQSEVADTALQVIVTLDHCLFGLPEIEGLQKAVTARTGVPAESM